MVSLGCKQRENVSANISEYFSFVLFHTHLENVIAEPIPQKQIQAIFVNIVFLAAKIASIHEITVCGFVVIEINVLECRQKMVRLYYCYCIKITLSMEWKSVLHGRYPRLVQSNVNRPTSHRCPIETHFTTEIILFSSKSYMTPLE